jgi:protoheme IX farnesyltransferase
LAVAGLLHTVIGTGLLASGAAALNQYLERDLDALMERTKDRPLPSGRVQPPTALLFGGMAAIAGLLYLAATTNLLTSLLGALTLVLYLFIYTPLKRLTTLNTIVGAVPGALPPLLGWAAARGEITTAGWALFALQFFWQLPHFLAISWLYRQDYARAGLRMRVVDDPTGQETAHLAISHALGLLAVSLSPFLFGVAGRLYLAGALALGLGFVWAAIRFARRRTDTQARRLFLASVVYLPLVLLLIVVDKGR